MLQDVTCSKRVTSPPQSAQARGGPTAMRRSSRSAAARPRPPGPKTSAGSRRTLALGGLGEGGGRVGRLGGRGVECELLALLLCDGIAPCHCWGENPAGLEFCCTVSVLTVDTPVAIALPATRRATDRQAKTSHHRVMPKPPIRPRPPIRPSTCKCPAPRAPAPRATCRSAPPPPHTAAAAPAARRRRRRRGRL
jgi:hypothetical protein